jgi:hypothetical protein
MERGKREQEGRRESKLKRGEGAGKEREGGGNHVTLVFMCAGLEIFFDGDLLGYDRDIVKGYGFPANLFLNSEFVYLLSGLCGGTC